MPLEGICRPCLLPSSLLCLPACTPPHHPALPFFLCRPLGSNTFLNSLQRIVFSLVICFGRSHPLQTSFTWGSYPASPHPYSFTGTQRWSCQFTISTEPGRAPVGVWHSWLQLYGCWPSRCPALSSLVSTQQVRLLVPLPKLMGFASYLSGCAWCPPRHFHPCSMWWSGWAVVCTALAFVGYKVRRNQNLTSYCHDPAHEKSISSLFWKKCHCIHWKKSNINVNKTQSYVNYSSEIC